MNSELLARGVNVGKILVGLGVPVPFASAMAGNAMLESGAQPVAQSPDGSNGLWQWRDAPGVSRLSALKQFATHYGISWTDETLQCRFAIYECTTDFAVLWAMRDSDKSVATLTLDWCDIFERPAASGRVPETRIAYAEAVSASLETLPAPAPIVVAPVLPSPSIPAPATASAPVSAPAPATASVTTVTTMEPSMPAILLADILPVIAPLVAQAMVALIKDLEQANPGMGATLKSILSSVAAGI